jgi:hypothetical protein
VIANLRQIHETHQRFLRSNARLVDEASALATRVVEHEVEHNPPFNPRSGRLQKSVEAKWVRTARGNLVKVRSDGRAAPYNLAIEHGTRPHVIRARRAKALRFVWHGTVMFRRQVNHPGTKPYYFLRSATFAGGHALETRLRLGMATLAKRF